MDPGLRVGGQEGTVGSQAIWLCVCVYLCDLGQMIQLGGVVSIK